MSRPKLLDYEKDWELIKNTQLQFLVEGKKGASVGIDHRFTSYGKKNSEDNSSEKKSHEADVRETILRALVAVAAFN